MGTPWTTSSEEFLRQNAGKLSATQIAESLGRSADAVLHRAKHLGVSLARDIHQHWSVEDLATLKLHYRKMNTTDLGKLLGRERKQVFNKAFELGLCIKQRINHAGLFELVKCRHADGYSDAEIAAEFGCERHTIGNVRHRLGLCNNANSQRRRDRVREKTREQLAAAGAASLGELRKQVYAGRSAIAGWPAGLRPRAVQILNALWQAGPMTRREIAEAVGMPWKGSRRSLVSNDPEGTYLQHLINRGLVMNLGRVNKVTGKSGHSTCVYSLPPWIERKASDERTV